MGGRAEFPSWYFWLYSVFAVIRCHVTTCIAHGVECRTTLHPQPINKVRIIEILDNCIWADTPTAFVQAMQAMQAMQARTNRICAGQQLVELSVQQPITRYWLYYTALVLAGKGWRLLRVPSSLHSSAILALPRFGEKKQASKEHDNIHLHHHRMIKKYSSGCKGV